MMVTGAMDGNWARLGMTGEYGPLEIVSLSGKPILAVSRVYSLQRTGGYFEGVP